MEDFSKYKRRKETEDEDNYTYNEKVDVVLGEKNKVVEGTILSIRGQILVVKIDEEELMLKINEGTVLKQWKPGREFVKFNRVDVRSKINKLVYEGFVTFCSQEFIEVIYKKDKEMIKEKYYFEDNFLTWVYPPGKFSSKFNPNIHSYQEVNTMLYKNKHFTPNENFQIKFEEEVKQKFMVYKIQGDGNCLYRSFSHQIYGDQEYYQYVKEGILEYLNLEKNFFSSYLPGGLKNFDLYLNMKRLDGVWGDDLEIQAFSELYNRSVFIYADGIKPLKTFHEEREEKRLKVNISYHGRAHYNSLLPVEEIEIVQYKEGILQTQPGEYEAIELKKISDHKKKDELVDISCLNINNESQNKHQDDESKLQFSRGKFVKEKNVDYLLKTKIDSNDFKPQENENEEKLTSKLEEDINKSILNQTDIYFQEEQILKSIIEESKKDTYSQQRQDQNSVNMIIEMGFTLEEATLALSAVGNDADLMLQYLYSLNEF